MLADQIIDSGIDANQMFEKDGLLILVTQGINEAILQILEMAIAIKAYLLILAI